MNQLELDPLKNYIPEHIKTIHLIGICGTGMGALAGMLTAGGYKVTGSDANVYPPMSDFLESLGIRPARGYDPKNLDHLPDLVVVGNVVTRLNPESPRLKELGLPYISFPQALKHFFLDGKKPLVVAGTHGKTTTSSLAAWLLESNGYDPGFMIGGILANYGRNFNLGQGDWFVVEGDEYDTAFFDKVPKFIHYAPHLGLLTSVEYDHADIYPDFEAVRKAFLRFVHLIPADGLLVAWGDDEQVRRMTGQASAPVSWYGLGEENDWRAMDLEPRGRRTHFVLRDPDGRKTPLFSPLPGLHNVLNTTAVAAALARVGLKPEDLVNGLETFKGVRRRQEVRGVVRGVTVIDDFAHHPTAVKQTVAAIRKAYNGSRLWAVFEPRTNTSRRKIFQNEYVEAFDGADRVLLREPADLAKIPVGERISVENLARDLNKRGIKTAWFENSDPLLECLIDELTGRDVVLIMSNGGFDNLHQRLMDGLAG